VGVWAKVPSVVIAFNHWIRNKKALLLAVVVGQLRKASFKVDEKLRVRYY